MITVTDRAQIYHASNRGFLFIDHAEADVGREDRCYQWRAPATAGHRWHRAAVDRFLTEIMPTCSPQLQAQFEGCIIVQAPICACCGDVAFHELTCVRPDPDPTKREYRCQKHRDRNPCAIEGCRRTAPADGHFASDQVICGEHWRRYVPKGSRARRAYLAHFRRAKRYGWTPENIEAWRRLWDLIVAKTRRQSTEGRLDEAEINKMSGWEDAA